MVHVTLLYGRVSRFEYLMGVWVYCTRCLLVIDFVWRGDGIMFIVLSWMLFDFLVSVVLIDLESMIEQGFDWGMFFVFMLWEVVCWLVYDGWVGLMIFVMVLVVCLVWMKLVGLYFELDLERVFVVVGLLRFEC